MFCKWCFAALDRAIWWLFFILLNKRAPMKNAFIFDGFDVN
ncbi:unnamed protein product, partial [Prunus brigantina]